jgi:methylmalonyl-CoA/ethylmalonyl-CoA epimerase
MRETDFDHIAIALDRIAAGLPFVVGELGGRYKEGGDAGAFLWRQYGYAGGGLLELLEPAGAAGGFLHRFLESRGPGVHHVTFKPPDLDESCRLAGELGFEVVGRHDTENWREAFLHPRSGTGTVVQLAWASADTAYDAVPPEDEPTPGAPGIALVGLRLAAGDRARAFRLWCDLLGGEAESYGEQTRVRWPDSPLRVTLHHQAGVDDGPLAVEVECLRPALLPRGPHPVLGVVFDPIDAASEPSDKTWSADEDPGTDEQHEVYILEEP